MAIQEERIIALEQRVSMLEQEQRATQLPRLEARMGSQERLQTTLHARIEELSEDVLASFRQQVAYQGQFEKHVDARFDQVDARFDKIEANMVAMEGRMQGSIDALEQRVLGAFQQLVTIIDQRLPPLEK